MSTKVEKSVLVNVPVSVAYNQWTQFEDFPHFMAGVKSVSHLSDDRFEWVAEIAGVRRRWEAKIVEQIPDRMVAWAAVEGATNAGSVSFEDVGGGQTSLRLTLDYEPEGVTEKIGDKLNVIEKQAEGDLNRFKAFIEDEGYASGAWRGSINNGAVAGSPDVEDAAASRGDSGKAGVSGKVAAGVGLAAAGAAAAAVAVAHNKDTADTADVPVRPSPSGESGRFITAEDAVGGHHQGSEPAGDGPIDHPFDQTNGLADIDGDSDGTAESDTKSSAERDDDTGRGGFPPNVAAGGQH
ncbi:SRPBCC family protein [Paenarthrobacter sp. Z7-10]|uniref:SRPBCC family protein n=1 Tax=Paenarthrobacter sp. Z7-10 TaxID=2787635 RepID=UPI0022A9EEB1|nr:SRPBCC family protein [Paenarthrobacter sp. Z7-10]MCZ2404548.1 SRPBCC family protein [Paenarthrobacter sp. Z7-10]